MSFTLYGVFLHCTPPDQYDEDEGVLPGTPAERLYLRLIDALPDPDACLDEWNDEPDRTHGDVIALLQRVLDQSGDGA